LSGARNRTQPIVNRPQAVSKIKDRSEQLSQALPIASKVKSSEPIRKSQLPIIAYEGIKIYSILTYGLLYSLTNKFLSEPINRQNLKYGQLFSSKNNLFN
jgi:hypothetical protein